MIYLGIDVGSHKVGLAKSASGIIAETTSSFEYHDREFLIDRIVQEVSDEKIEKVVVGVPYRRDGSLAEHGQAVLILVEALRDCLGENVVETVDEALTSKEAERLGGKAADHDALAAALILEQYLNEHREG